MYRTTILAVCLALSLVSSVGAEELSASIVNYGMIEASEPIAALQAPKSHTGAIFVMDRDEVPTFRGTGKQVVAEVGVRFGLHVQLNGESDGTIRPLVTRVTHPAFESGVTVDEWDTPLNIGYARFTGWLFESEAELVPGIWRFEVLDDERVLVSQEFEVELPKQ